MRAKLFWYTLICLAALAGSASAHPHVWIDVVADVGLDEEGRVNAVSMEWVFDDIYSLYAVEGYDADGDGSYTPEELRPMVTENVANLEEWRYFLDAGEAVEFGAVTDYGASFKDDRLVLRLTVPFADPVAATEQTPLRIRIYDPSFYIAVGLSESGPVRFTPSGRCTSEIVPAPGVDEARLLTENLFEQDVEPGTEGIGAAFADTIVVICGDAS